MKKQTSSFVALASAVLTLTIATAALAHGDKHQKQDKSAVVLSTEEKVFGQEGDPKHVTRTVRIAMNDSMRFDPSTINIRQGETVRFIVKNEGKLMHEMVLGTMSELKEHGELMKKNPEMEHDEPYMSHVQPGATEEMVWRFTRPGTFHYGCLVPGHFDAGMMGKIIVTKRK